MTTKVVKESIWTLAGQVAPLGVSLITVPIVIRLLGADGYGVLVREKREKKKPLFLV